MTSNYNIIIKNMSSVTNSFYVFQYQSIFSTSSTTPQAKSSSLAYGVLSPNSIYGSQLTFSLSSQVYVGAITNSTTAYLGSAEAGIYMLNAENNSGESSAIQPISLTPASSPANTNNNSNLSLSPLGLSSAYYQESVPTGNFGINSPSYSPSPALEIYVGNAAINQDGSIILSSFITPPPSTQIFCAPKPIFFVSVGAEEAGQPIVYDTSNSAECDFTTGYTTITVQYKADGTFSTSGS